MLSLDCLNDNFSRDQEFLSHHIYKLVTSFLEEKLKISPEQIIYVGNEYKYDIIGAKKAGMKAAHLAQKPVPDSAADMTFSDFRDLQGYILGN